MSTPLNVFKTVTATLSDVDAVLYTAPTGFTGIILMAQVANVTASSAQVTFSHFKTQGGIQTELIKDFALAGNDAINAVTGKLILEDGDSVKGFASANDTLKITLSVLESLNA